ncbi:hypothetical protein [Mycobacterium sp. URHB0021]
MYQLIIASDATTSTTDHDDFDHARRALIEHVVDADLYLCGDQLFGEAAHRAPFAIEFDLLALSPSGRQPHRVGTATIAAPATGVAVARQDLAEATQHRSEAVVPQCTRTMWGAHAS